MGVRKRTEGREQVTGEGLSQSYQQSGDKDLKRSGVKREQHPVPTQELGQGQSPYGAELAETEKTESAAAGPTGAAGEGCGRGQSRAAQGRGRKGRRLGARRRRGPGSRARTGRPGTNPF